MPIQIPVTQVGLEASIQAAAQSAGRNLKIDLGSASKSIGSLSQPLGRITGQADDFTKSMEAANARVLAFGASVGVLSAVTAGFKQMINVTIQVEKSLADINSVLGASSGQLNKFKNDIFSIAKETGNSFATVSEAALELSRQGLKSDEVLRRLKDSMILARLSGLDAGSAVEGLTAAVNSFSKTGVTTSEVLNKLSNTAAKFAISERDLIQGFQRSASVAQQAGVSLDELGGIITAVQQKTARGGAVIGNAFKTIFTRIQRPESLQALQDVGAAVTDAQGGILPATKLIENLAEKINGLNDIQRANITEKIGGGFQIGPLLAALDDLSSKTSTFQGATEAMANAGSEAYGRNTALNQTLAAAINSTTVSMQQLANTLGELGVTDNLKNLLSYFSSFTDSVQNLLEGDTLGSDFAKGIVKGIGGVLSGPGLLIFGAIIAKLTFNFIKFGNEALKTFFNIGNSAKELNAVQTTITNTLLNNKNIQSQILALEGNRVAQAKFFSTALNTQLATMEKMRSIAASIAPAVVAGTSPRSRRAADGYMPSVMAESSDIKRGVGGAKPSDRPVVIPNFNFGSGKKGTMVANSGEYLVPNFGGGSGSAIFNREMVGRMGLPSNAQKINSAGGFVPNFVRDLFVDKFGLSRSTVQREWNSFKESYAGNDAPSAAEAYSSNQKVTDAFVSWRNSPQRRNIKVGENEQRLLSKAESVSGKARYAFIYNSNKNQSNNLPYKTEKGRSGVFKAIGVAVEPEDYLYDEVRSGLINSAKNYAKQLNIDPDLVNDDKFSNIVGQSLNRGSVEGALGTVFESAFNGAIQSLPGSQVAGFDLSQQSVVNLKKVFNKIGKNPKSELSSALDSSILAGDFKNALNISNQKSFLKKIDNFEGQVPSAISKKLSETSNNKANGYIPNFAQKSFRIGDDYGGLYRRYKTEKGSFLDFELIDGQDEKTLNIDEMKSKKKGDAFELFKRLAKLSKRTKIPIYSNELVSQADRKSKRLKKPVDFDKMSNWDELIYNFPQLRYRQIPDLVTSGRFGTSSYNFETIDELKKLVTEMSKKDFRFEMMYGVDELTSKYAADGYIPNFADALKEAISREIGAGVDPSQVYIDQSSSLKNAGNPMGLMVANRRDEPQGGFQGIARARKEGANAQFYGAADGFIPNYADSNLTPFVGMTRSDALDAANKQYEKALKEQIAAIDADIKATESKRGKVKLNGDAYKKHTDTLAKLNAASTNLSSDMQKENELLKKSITNSTKGVLGTGRTIVGTQAKVSEKTEKGPKDLLGTIFALQAGFSALSAGTSDATSQVAKYTNIVSEGLSSGTTATFALQGLGAALPKFAGFLGPAGVAIGALTAAYEIGTEIYNENSGINKTVAESLDRVGKAAAEASTNLDKLSPAGKKRVEEQAKSSVQESLKTGNRITQGVPTMGGYTSATYDEVARFDKDVTGKLRESLFDLQAQALATGVPVEKLNKKIQEFSGDALITQNEIKKISLSFEGFIDDIKKGDIELKKLNLNPNEGPGALIGQMSLQDVQKFIDPKLRTNEEKAKDAGYKTYEEYQRKKFEFTPEAKAKSEANPLNLIKQGLIRGGVAEGSEAFNTKLLDEAKKLIDGYQKIQEDVITNTQSLNIEYNKTLEILRSEINLRELNSKIDNEISGKGGAKLEAERQLLEVSKDLNLSDVERANKIEDINKGLDNQLKKLELQKSLAKDLQASFSKLFTAIGVQNPDQKANQLFQKINSTSSEQKSTIGNQLLAGNEGSFNEYLKSLQLANNETDAIKSTLAEWFTNLALSTSELAKQQGYEGDISDAVRKRLALEKTNTDNLAKRNQLLESSINLKQQSRQIDIAAYSEEEFAARKRVTALGQTKLGETSLQNLRREAEAARIQREILTPTDQSRAISEKKETAFQTAKSLVSGQLLEGADPSQIGQIKTDLEKITNFDQLRVKYSGDLKGNLDLIEEIYKKEIDALEKNNEASKEGVSLAEQRLALIQRGAAGGIESGLGKLKDENEMFAFDLGERIPQLFADNMASAMEAVIMQGESLGDSLRSAASSFLNEITKANLKNLAGGITGSIGSGIGTLFKANGGKITGGSGNKDDVPAMLMGGEYVINKKSVSKYGSTFMESLNNGTLQGFAKGGSVIRGRGINSDVISNTDPGFQTGEGGFQMPGYYGQGTISGKKNLLAFARQGYTSGANDIISSGNNSSYIDLEGESVRLTNFGRRNGPMADAIRESKGQAFDLYKQQLAAEKQAREEEKARKEAFRNSIKMALISTAVGVVGKAATSGFQAGATSAGQDATIGERFGAGFKGIFSGGDIGEGVQSGGIKNLFSGNFALSQISSTQELSSYLNTNPNSDFAKQLRLNSPDMFNNGKFIERALPFDSNYSLFNGSSFDLPDGKETFGSPMDSSLLPPKTFKNATGGLIPSAGGIDTVPAMLSGGEFIMNAAATQRIGPSNLNAMNSGSSNTDSKDLNDKLISKLDELITASKESSKGVTVNVTSDGRGNTQESTEGQSSSDQDKNLSRKIKAAVVSVLQEEKRLGGVLRRR